MIELSQRLKTIASYIQAGAKVADIGSDHGYLPIYLLQSGKASFAIAGEVNEGPFKSARDKVQETGLSDKIKVRLGDGLSVLSPEEVDSICIAGMGGTLICTILEKGLDMLSSVSHLILQPNVAEKNVREWLFLHGWELKGESILEEDQIIYEVLYAEKGDPNKPYNKKPWSKEQWFELGPFLWGSRSPVLIKKWQNERAKVQHVLHSLQNAHSTEAMEKKREMQKRFDWIEEVLSCMQRDKQ
jgi:tRNA (adenine22-N1)-methyltransferase